MGLSWVQNPSHSGDRPRGHTVFPDTDGRHQRTPRRGSAAVHKHYNVRMDLPCVPQIPPDSSSGCLLPVCSTLSTPAPTAFWLHPFHPFQPCALQLTWAPLTSLSHRGRPGGAGQAAGMGRTQAKASTWAPAHPRCARRSPRTSRSGSCSGAGLGRAWKQRPPSACCRPSAAPSRWCSRCRGCRSCQLSLEGSKGTGFNEHG